MSEPRWTYVTPADSPNRVLHLPGCRMMTETEKLGRVRTVEGFEGRAPMTLGDLLCKHCQKRADPLPKIRERMAERVLHPAERADVDWLIAEIERLREVPLL